MTSPVLRQKDSYDIKEIIGKGGYGTVVRIIVKENQEELALKQIDLKNISNENDKKLVLDQSRFEYELQRKK